MVIYFVKMFIFISFGENVLGYFWLLVNIWSLLLSIFDNVRDIIKEGIKRYKWRIWGNWNVILLESMIFGWVKIDLLGVYL